MVVNGLEVLERVIRKHAELQGPLTAWLDLARTAEWHDITAVRSLCPSADGVSIRKGKRIAGIVTVFNIGGNQYRLLTAIDYARHRLTVIDVLTHAEYSKDRWKGQM